ncbi:alpha-hydroxy-acid oxidizing protein [Pseudomaricurvus alkylphenolicus]|uniref:alpha-hydroxy acid oxidase n=1 Tax=Pseudomaricurvus alkylphenolicus TaxID=1306991 RepID=UPI0014230BC3|nr:alpha-hydroxy acid oxidase [Pseudomaricurvus alkylphenolicus]NIB43626.1 alpha-hydroxy-acid oxidizing protein [Pseudomaricurvus alkylphenolicus]
MTSKLDQCYNIDDLRLLAKKRLPRAMYDYIAGFAEDGVCGERNRSAFYHYEFVPRMLRDVSDVDTSTTVLGESIDFPVILAPTALSRLFHHQGEWAVAAAASKMNTIYSLSTLSSVSIEKVTEFEGPKWFQIYVYKDRSLVKEFIDRARTAGYRALCLTVDAAVSGNREQDLRNGFTVPPQPSFKTVVETLTHPQWLWHHFTSPTVTTANVSGERMAGKNDTNSFLSYVNQQLTPTVTWSDVEWMRSQWDGPLVIKGLMSVEDARMAARMGADGIVLSNHGGRQLDHAAATLDLLPQMVDQVGAQLEIIIDSGIRRGTDVAKALALGAKACMVGRPYLYGLSAGGEAGVLRALQLFQQEFHRTLQLLGCPSVAELDSSYLRMAKQGVDFETGSAVQQPTSLQVV